MSDFEAILEVNDGAASPQARSGCRTRSLPLSLERSVMSKNNRIGSYRFMFSVKCESLRPEKMIENCNTPSQ